jgi:hypothetical protein
MSELQQFPTLPSQAFRLDVPLHELLQQTSREASPQLPTLRKAETLPTAVFHGRRKLRKTLRLYVESRRTYGNQGL